MIDGPDLVLHAAARGTRECEGYRHHGEHGHPDSPGTPSFHPTPPTLATRSHPRLYLTRSQPHARLTGDARAGICRRTVEERRFAAQSIRKDQLAARSNIARVMRIPAAAVLCVLIAASPAAQTVDHLTLVAPAAPGGGWDQTARALQHVIDAHDLARIVEVQNVPGAAGTIGLSQFVDAQRGNGRALLVTGLVMVGATLWNDSPVSVNQATPIARLTGEYEVIAVPASSPLTDMRALIDEFRRRPDGVRVGRRLRRRHRSHPRGAASPKLPASIRGGSTTSRSRAGARRWRRCSADTSLPGSAATASSRRTSPRAVCARWRFRRRRDFPGSTFRRSAKTGSTSRCRTGAACSRRRHHRGRPRALTALVRTAVARATTGSKS